MEEEDPRGDDEMEVDFFDPYRARHQGDEEPSKGESLILTAPLLPTFEAIQLSEWLEEQRNDDFCNRILSRQSEKTDSAFSEDEDGLLRRRALLDGAEQIVVPKTLKPRLLTMCHRSVLAGHPGQTRMYDTMRRTYYWPQMAADIAATVRDCGPVRRISYASVRGQTSSRYFLR